MAEEYTDEVARKANEAIQTAIQKRDSLLLSVAQLNKVIGGQQAFDGFNMDSVMALWKKYKPMLVKAGIFGAGGGAFSFLPAIKSFLGGLLG